MVDRRGFFASLGAALLAPLVKVLPNTENARRVGLYGWQEVGFVAPLRYSSVPLYDIVPRASTLKSHPYNDGENDMYIPGLTTLSSEADPFQTFVVDTNEVV